MTQRARAIAWTMGQYSLFLPLAFGGSVPIPPGGSIRSVVGWSLLAAAVLLTLWALWAFRSTRLHLTPLVRQGGMLITSGPYRWVRHPMYTAVLILSGGLVVLDPTWLRIISAFALFPVLFFKLNLEETFLREAYPEYSHYALQTKRLVPGIW